MKKWYCSLPWTGFSNDPDGRVRPCCLYKDYIVDDDGQPLYVQTHSVKDIFSGRYMKDLRQKFRDGEKPRACEVCIRDEDNGYTSKRINYLNSHRELGDIDFDSEPDYPIQYQMILSNACNLKCRSCSPSHSNSWQAEYQRVWGHTGYRMPHGQSGDKKTVLWEDRNSWIRHIQRIEVVGGEPFYIKQWQNLWDELISRGYSKNVSLWMSSNATIYAGEEIERLNKEFKYVSVALSIDGLGRMYEYLRHPGRWSDVEKNIRAYHDSGMNFSYSHTIGWLNAWAVPDFHLWAQANTPRFPIWNNIIHSPKHMSIVSIPESAKRIIDHRWRAHNWGIYQKDMEGILNFMWSEQPTDDEIRRRYQEFLRYDAVRGENVLDIIPLELLPEVKKYFA